MMTPYNVKPNKKRAFRIIKKWFNRYERRTLLMHALYINNEISAYITDIRLIKTHKQDLLVVSSPHLMTQIRLNPS